MKSHYKTDKKRRCHLAARQTNRGTGQDDAYFDLALDFIQLHPAGTELTSEKFDKFVVEHRELEAWRDRAEAIGLYEVPPDDEPTNSDKYVAFLHRRLLLRNRMNNASTTPRMIEAVASVTGRTGYAFSINVPKGTVEGGSSTKHYGKLVVRTCLDAYVDSADLSDLMKRLKGEQKKLRFLKQSLGYDHLDSHEKDEVDDLEEIIGYRKSFEEQASACTRVSTRRGTGWSARPRRRCSRPRAATPTETLSNWRHLRLRLSSQRLPQPSGRFGRHKCRTDGRSLRSTAAHASPYSLQTRRDDPASRKG